MSWIDGLNENSQQGKDLLTFANEHIITQQFISNFQFYQLTNV